MQLEIKMPFFTGTDGKKIRHKIQKGKIKREPWKFHYIFNMFKNVLNIWWGPTMSKFELTFLHMRLSDPKNVHKGAPICRLVDYSLGKGSIYAYV